MTSPSQEQPCHPMKDILCKGVGGGAEAPPDFKFMLLCVQAVTAKGHPKCIIITKKIQDPKINVLL